MFWYGHGILAAAISHLQIAGGENVVVQVHLFVKEACIDKLMDVFPERVVLAACVEVERVDERFVEFHIAATAAYVGHQDHVDKK